MTHEHIEYTPPQYKLLTSNSDTELENEVNKLAKEGWELFGIISVHLAPPKGELYYQWMVKPASETVRCVDSTAVTELHRLIAEAGIQGF